MKSGLLLLGANQGDVESMLDRAIEMIAKRVGRVELTSCRYITPAWGFECEELFTNQAVEVVTSLDGLALLDVTQSIERELGRDFQQELSDKEQSGERYASRRIDIDIIFLGDEVINESRLTLPHPQMHRREFVLRPLAEIAPCRVHPISGVSVEQLLKEIDNGGEE